MNYSENNIQTLNFMTAVRTRPAMYIDSIGQHGLFKIDSEPFQNSCDEAITGNATKCIIHYDKTKGMMSIQDDGRGIPIGKLHEILTVPHTGGKFNRNAYAISGGQNGIGIKATNALSIYFKCEVYRLAYIDENNTHHPAQHAIYEYSKGVLQNKTIEDLPDSSTKHGTYIEYISDDEIMKTHDRDVDRFINYLNLASYIIPNFYIEYSIDNDKPIIFQHNGGIEEFLVDFCKSKKIKTIIPNIKVSGKYDNIQKLDGSFSWDIIFTYNPNNSGDSNIKSYVNGIYTVAHGQHVSGMRAGLSLALTQYMNETNAIPKALKDINVSGSFISDNIVAIVGVQHQNPLYNGQTKEKLNSEEVYEPIKQACRSVFIKWLYDNPKDAKKLVDMAIDYAKYEAEKKKLKENLIKTKTVKSAFAANGVSPDKYMQCTSNNPEEKELFIVEGESAGGSASKVMKSRFQALYKLKGKTLNVARSNINTINNKELLDIEQITGLGHPSNPTYKNLQFYKIIIMTDADDDGAHIQSLLLTFFYLAYPKVIEDGHIFIAQPPIKSIKLRNNKPIYLHTEADYERIMSECIVNTFELHSLQNNKKLSEGFFRCFINACVGYDILIDNYCNALSLDPDLLELICVYINDLIGGKWDVFKKHGYEVSRNKELFVFDKGTKHMNLIIDDEFIDHTYNVIFDKLRDIEFYGFYLKGIRSGKEYHGTIYHLMKIMYGILGNNSVIKRFKGLGEMCPEELWETTLDPNTRVLSKVTINDAIKAKRSVDVFMGSDNGENADFKRKFFAGEVDFD